MWTIHRSNILCRAPYAHSLCRGSGPFSTPELPRAGYLVRERVSVGAFSYRVADSEDFDEPRGESTAHSPRLVEEEVVFSEVCKVDRSRGCIAGRGVIRERLARSGAHRRPNP